MIIDRHTMAKLETATASDERHPELAIISKNLAGHVAELSAALDTSRSALRRIHGDRQKAELATGGEPASDSAIDIILDQLRHLGRLVTDAREIASELNEIG